MQSKKTSRLRRAKRTRSRILKQEMARLCVFRTPRHIYAQVIAPSGDAVVAAASTVNKDIRSNLSGTGNAAAAAAVGKAIAERSLQAGVKTVAFDRSGFAFHGRVKALAEAAREGGLEF